MDPVVNMDALYGHWLGVHINKVLLYHVYILFRVLYNIFNWCFIAQTSRFKFLTLSWFAAIEVTLWLLVSLYQNEILVKYLADS